MKKIGLLALVLVLALSAVGVGFAKWTDSVKFHGVVRTGEVSIGIADLGTTDDGYTSAWEFNRPDIGLDEQADWILDLNPGIVDDLKDVASFISTNRGNVVGTRTLDVTPWRSVDNPHPSVQDIQFVDGVEEVMNCVYPGYTAATRLAISNFGCVPVKIEDINFEISEVPGYTNAAILDFMVVTGWYAYLPDGNMMDFPLVADDGERLTICDLGEVLEGYQLHEGDTIMIGLKISFLEAIDKYDFMLPQDSGVAFTITVDATQWNEVV